MPDDTADTPLFKILDTTSYVQAPKTMINVDSTPKFAALKSEERGVILKKKEQ